MAGRERQVADETQSMVAVFDLDGTITDCDTYLKFLGLCLIRRPRRVIRALHLPFAVLLHKIGIYDNAWLKTRFLKAIAGGYSAVALRELTDTLVADIVENHVRAAALDAIDGHRQAGHRLVLATASFDFYVRVLADKLGFDEVVCTHALRGSDDVLEGEIDGENCYGPAKVAAVMKALPDRQGVSLTAYTDHHSDWGLLMESDVGVAISPTPELRQLAAQRDLEVRMW